MASAGWVYQRRENTRKFSFSSGGNVSEKTVEVKAGKFFAGCCLLVASCWFRLRRFETQPTTNNPRPTTNNPQPTTHQPQRFLYKLTRLHDCSSRPDFDSLPQKIKHASDL